MNTHLYVGVANQVEFFNRFNGFLRNLRKSRAHRLKRNR
jgi:hypothetical protein